MYLESNPCFFFIAVFRARNLCMNLYFFSTEVEADELSECQTHCNLVADVASYFGIVNCSV